MYAYYDYYCYLRPLGGLGGLPGASWGLFGASLGSLEGLLGAFWGPLGGLLEASRLEDLLKASWRPLGTLLGSLSKSSKNPRLLRPEAHFDCKNTVCLISWGSERPAETRGHQKVRQSRTESLFYVDTCISKRHDVEGRQTMSWLARRLQDSLNISKSATVSSVFATFVKSINLLLTKMYKNHRKRRGKQEGQHKPVLA